jgi:hypothetical protein
VQMQSMSFPPLFLRAWCHLMCIVTITIKCTANHWQGDAGKKFRGHRTKHAYSTAGILSQYSDCHKKGPSEFVSSKTA